MDWFHKQTEWTECASYNDPENCTPGLRARLKEMIENFPALNGPLSTLDPFTMDDDETRFADYSVGKSMIYITFLWSEAADAYRLTFGLAKKHRIGFFDVSAGGGQVWIPFGNDGYRCAHGEGTSSG
jgi:hypothetical protein